MATVVDSLERDESISARELLAMLWRGRWWCLSAVVLCTVLGALGAWLTPNRYSAAIVVAPVSNSSGGGQLGGLASLASQSGLASLAGISLGGDSRKWESLAVLQSEALTQKYINGQQLLPVLFPKEWDASSRQWKPGPAEDQPTAWKANELFKKKVRSTFTDPKTGLVTLTITWTDPQLAAKWANDLVALTNGYLRDKAIAESERNIAYLNEQATVTEAVGIRQTIYKILETEINKAMLARGSDEYALKVLDPAIAPEKPSNPPPWAWIVGGVLCGVGLSLFAAFALVVWRGN